MDLAGHHVAVTGASTGIGRAAALMLASKGATVSLIARSQDKLEALAAEIEAAGGKAASFPADVANRTALEAAFDAAAARFGPVQAFVAGPCP